MEGKYFLTCDVHFEISLEYLIEVKLVSKYKNLNFKTLIRSFGKLAF